jgi:hypothetical protein
MQKSTPSLLKGKRGVHRASGTWQRDTVALGERGRGAHLDLANQRGDLAGLWARTTRLSPTTTMGGKDRGGAPAGAEPDNNEAEGDGVAPSSSPTLSSPRRSGGSQLPVRLCRAQWPPAPSLVLRHAGDPPWPPRRWISTGGGRGEGRGGEGAPMANAGREDGAPRPPPSCWLRRAAPVTLRSHRKEVGGMCCLIACCCWRYRFEMGGQTIVRVRQFTICLSKCHLLLDLVLPSCFM